MNARRIRSRSANPGLLRDLASRETAFFHHEPGSLQPKSFEARDILRLMRMSSTANELAGI